MADRIDAAVDAVQLSSLDTKRDRVGAQTAFTELRSRHHAVLSSRRSR
jgi:hypothetical protein